MNRGKPRAESFRKYSSGDIDKKGHGPRLTPLAVAAVVVAITLIVNSQSAVAKIDCDSGSDVAESSRCFLRQFPCIASYFGVDQPPDYPRALKCFEADKAWDFVALMYLNGQGTPRDLQKANDIIQAGRKAEPYSDSFSQLEKAVRDCRDRLKSCQRVDFCSELAFSTFDMEVCSAVDQLKAEAGLSRTVASISGGLNATNRVVLDRAVTEFKAYQLAESGREYDIYFDGTIRGLASNGQGEFVRDNFEKLVADTVQARQLKPACADAVKAADGEVERLYGRDLKENIEQWQKEATRDDASRREYTEIIKDYRKIAGESQAHWVNYQDLMAELAERLYPDRAGACNAANGMKVAIAKNRVAELRYNPIGPEDKN